MKIQDPIPREGLEISHLDQLPKNYFGNVINKLSSNNFNSVAFYGDQNNLKSIGIRFIRCLSRLLPKCLNKIRLKNLFFSRKD